MLQISGNTIQERFLSAVSALNLRFPGTAIAKKTGYNKGTVSAYLKNLEPSEAFLKTFCQQFEVDFGQIWTGRAPETKNENPEKKAEPSPMQILDRLSMAFVEQAKALADQAEGFKAQAEAFKAQAELMKTMRGEMAQQADLLAIKESVTGDRSNLTRILVGVEKISLDQDDDRREFRSLLTPAGGKKKAPSQGAGRKSHRIDGAG